MGVLTALIVATLLIISEASSDINMGSTTAKQSSTYNNFDAVNVLSNNNGDCASHGFSHTLNEWQPYLTIDLGSIYKVDQVKVTVRKSWTQYIRVYVKSEMPPIGTATGKGNLCGSHNITGGETNNFPCNNFYARYVTVMRDNDGEYLEHRRTNQALVLCFVQVTGTKVLCGYPQVGTGVQISGSQREPGSKVTFSCPAHHTQSGSSQATCSMYGDWQYSGTIPSCSKITCTAPMALRYGSFSPVQGEYVPTNRVVYTCNENYKLTGGSVAICSGDGRWDFQGSGIPTCSVLECDRLQLGQYMTVSGEGRTIGSRRSFTCTQGYQLHGITSITCELVGGAAKWSGSVPTCSKKSCPAPDNVQNGQIIGLDYSYGKTVVYKCLDGYTLQGNEQIRCMANGQWSGSAPTCSKVQCRDPGVPENGAKSGDDYSFGQTVTYTCNAGYKVSGATEITCEDTGTWTGRKPTCEPLECPSVIAPQHGNKDGDLFEFGSIVKYSCFPGYALEGSNTATCQADQTWSSDKPTCKACSIGYYKENPDKDNCEKCPVHSTTITQASTSRLHCTCVANTVGNPGGPCEVITCPKLQAPQNGELVDPTCGTSVGARCEFACNEGHILRGSKERTCEKGGWSGEDVSCEACRPNTYTAYKGALMCSACDRNSGTNGKPGINKESCECDSGYLGPKGGPCLDIDECLDTNAETKVCEQKCHNDPGSYTCSCNIPGFVLAADKKSCTKNRSCPALGQQKPGNGNIACTYTASTNGHVCTISCDPGYFFVSGVNNYITCGKETDFQWSHRVKNSTARMPSCTKEFYVDVSLPWSGKYNLAGSCANNPMTESQFKDVVERAMNTRTECKNMCVASEITQSCSGSQVTYKFDITFPNVRPNVVGPDCNITCKRQNLRDVLTSANSMRTSLETLATNNPDIFQLQQDGAPTLVPGTFKLSGRPDLLCEEGKVFTTDRLCVPCDRGFYMANRKDDHCEPCKIGTFQDLQGQTSCKKCYEGSTTLQQAADHPTMCSEKVEVENNQR